MGQSLIGAKAHIPNPALEPLRFLIGDWRTTGTHPALPGQTLNGRTSFSWHEGGAFLLMRSEVEDPQFPDGLAIIGSSDAANRYSMIYFDERGTSRIFEVSAGDQKISWRRDDPDFSQSLTIAVGRDPDTLISKGRMSKPGETWADDLSQEFHRIMESAA